MVVIGVREDGTKELLAVEDGYRESTESWAWVMRDLKARGLFEPKLVTGDGALGIWAALRDVYPEARAQRCWVHKIANVLDCLPKRVQPRAKQQLHEIMEAPTRQAAARRSMTSGASSRPSTRRRPRSSRRTAPSCWPSTHSRPSTGATCAPQTRSSRPSRR